MQLGRVALKGGVVTGLSQVVKVIVSMVSVIVLARLLAPEDFGLVASVGPLVAFIGILQNLGLQQAVIQRSVIDDHQLNQVFWIGTLAGLAAAALVVAAAPLAAAFYGDLRVRGIMTLSAFPMILGAVASVPLSLLSRNLRFGVLALNETLTALSSFLGALAGALLGFGYWSLVFGMVLSSVVSLVTAWVAQPYRPGKPTVRIQSDMLTFGANLTGFNLVNFLARNLDNILIARVLGLTALGYYDRAYKLLLFPLQTITWPLSRLMVPLLSRIQDDKPRLRLVFLKTNWMLGLLTMPGIAALTMTSHSVVLILFGERWMEVAPIFAWLGIAGFSQIVLSTNGWIFVAQGRTREMFLLGLWTSGTSVLSFVVGLHWGVTGVAAAYAISAYVLRIPVSVVVIGRVGPVSAGDILSIVGLFGAAAMLAYGLFRATPVTTAWQPDLVSIVWALLLNSSVAAVLVFAYEPARRLVRETLIMIRAAMT